uniref:Uncharacterized protein n=1 Tax=viral metagenome TaxID=1070528 RepID=A0A6C0EC27_9ZZZZ
MFTVLWSPTIAFLFCHLFLKKRLKTRRPIFYYHLFTCSLLVMIYLLNSRGCGIVFDLDWFDFLTYEKFILVFYMANQIVLFGLLEFDTNGLLNKYIFDVQNQQTEFALPLLFNDP